MSLSEPPTPTSANGASHSVFTFEALTLPTLLTTNRDIFSPTPPNPDPPLLTSEIPAISTLSPPPPLSNHNPTSPTATRTPPSLSEPLPSPIATTIRPPFSPRPMDSPSASPVALQPPIDMDRGRRNALIISQRPNLSPSLSPGQLGAGQRSPGEDPGPREEELGEDAESLQQGLNIFSPTARRGSVNTPNNTYQTDIRDWFSYPSSVDCPVCGGPIAGASHEAINEHVDLCMARAASRESDDNARFAAANNGNAPPPLPPAPFQPSAPTATSDDLPTASSAAAAAAAVVDDGSIPQLPTPPGSPIPSEVYGTRPDSPTSAAEFLCKYCMDEEDTKKMMSPCDCQGSVKWVHEKCLVKWFSARNLSKEALPHQSCSVCHRPFKPVESHVLAKHLPSAAQQAEEALSYLRAHPRLTARRVQYPSSIVNAQIRARRRREAPFRWLTNPPSQSLRRRRYSERDIEPDSSEGERGDSDLEPGELHGPFSASPFQALSMRSSMDLLRAARALRVDAFNDARTLVHPHNLLPTTTTTTTTTISSNTASADPANEVPVAPIYPPNFDPLPMIHLGGALPPPPPRPEPVSTLTPWLMAGTTPQHPPFPESLMLQSPHASRERLNSPTPPTSPPPVPPPPGPSATAQLFDQMDLQMRLLSASSVPMADVWMAHSGGGASTHTVGQLNINVVMHTLDEPMNAAVAASTMSDDVVLAVASDEASWKALQAWGVSRGSVLRSASASSMSSTTSSSSSSSSSRSRLRGLMGSMSFFRRRSSGGGDSVASLASTVSSGSAVGSETSSFASLAEVTQAQRRDPAPLVVMLLTDRENSTVTADGKVDAEDASAWAQSLGAQVFVRVPVDMNDITSAAVAEGFGLAYHAAVKGKNSDSTLSRNNSATSTANSMSRSGSSRASVGAANHDAAVNDCVDQPAPPLIRRRSLGWIRAGLSARRRAM